MTKRMFCALLYVLAFIANAEADQKFLFEIPGDRRTVGSWSVVLQDAAALMVAPGETVSRKYPDTLGTAAPRSTLTMLCEAGGIQLYAALPSSDDLIAGGDKERFGFYILWVNGELVGRVAVDVKDVEHEDGFLVVPIFSYRGWDEAMSRYIDAEKITVRASAMNLNMVSAEFALSGTREAFSLVQQACGRESQ